MMLHLNNKETKIQSESESRSVKSNSLRPEGILHALILEWVAFPAPGDLPNPRIKPKYPALKADSLPAEPHGKPQTQRG